ncbi:hypothetical protein BG015_004260 [Linnemannia schmuckeri]|uniref:Uncharacterized protein n=1 Tax=Linnemannia schmuckeri TaxID=64567 RepID=A0A9P5RCK4_9FUNG|nr:hypothetical protein BG015_004260 [Linnemannia schmuckeri]
MQANKEVHNTLRHTPLNSICAWQWHRPSCPLAFKATPYDDADLKYLQRIHHLNWHDNCRIRTDIGNVHKILNPEPTSAEMANLLLSSPLMKSLTIRGRTKVFEQDVRAPIRQMESLRWLTIDLPTRDPPVPIQDLYALSQQLDRLSLGGSWYQCEGQRLSEHHI